MLELKNSRLNVKIAEPNKECVTSRFDRAGIITQVSLDDTHTFLGQEDMHDGSPSSGGVGLCSEIQCDPLSASVKIGERFPKFGVGNLLKKTEEPYFFMNSYDCQSYDISVTQSESQIVFETAPCVAGGYGIYQKKMISIEDNTLSMEYTIKNVGDVQITFEEYCHNFMSLNHKKINKDFYLTIPCLNLPQGEIKTHPDSTTFFSDGIGLSKSEESMVFALYAFEPDQMVSVPEYSWTLLDKEQNISVSEIDDFDVKHVTVWSVGDAISPEMFFGATLNPGEQTSWTRTWVFNS